MRTFQVTIGNSLARGAARDGNNTGKRVRLPVPPAYSALMTHIDAPVLAAGNQDNRVGIWPWQHAGKRTPTTAKWA